MKITVRNVDDVRILDCSGDITMGPGTASLRHRVQDAVEQGANKLVLNLGGVKYIDSSGIGELVHSHNTLTQSGGQLRLMNLTKKIWDPLLITRLMTVFQAFNDEQSALESFKHPK